MAHIGEMGNEYSVLIRKFEENRPFGISTYRGEDNIRMHLKEMGLEGGVWIDLFHDRDRWRAIVNTVMNHQ